MTEHDLAMIALAGERLCDSCNWRTATTVLSVSDWTMFACGHCLHRGDFAVEVAEDEFDDEMDDLVDSVFLVQPHRGEHLLEGWV